MAETIRGLTIEISADPTNFNKQFNKIKKDVKSTQSEFDALKKSLELDFDNSKFTKAQKLAQQAIDETKEKAELLNERLKYLESIKQVDTAPYRAVKAELEKTNTEVLKLQNELKNLDKLKFDNLTNEIDKVASGLSSVAKTVAPISAIAGGALVGIGKLGKEAASTGAQIDDLALRFGVSAEKIQEWQYVAVQTGVDVEVFNKALIKARAAILDFSNGKINEQTKAIQGLKLELSSFKTQEDMFDGVIDALSKMEDKTLQASYANEIFGDKIAYQLLPFLNAGKDAINTFKAEFQEMPYLTNEQVATLATLDDTLFRVKEAFKNIGLQIGTVFMPIILKITEIIETKVVPKLMSIMNWLSSLSEKTIEFGLKVLAVVAMLAPVLVLLSKLTSGISGIIKLIPKLSSALSTLAAHPIIAIIGIIATLLMLLYTTNEKFRESINNLITTLTSALTPILEIIMNVLHSLFDAIVPIINVIGNILGNVLNMIVASLTPIFELLSMLFQLLGPLIELQLIPLQLALKALEVPLQLLGALLEWLMPLFNLFSNVVKGAFNVVIKIINIVLGAVEDAINWCIDKINSLIAAINKAGGWLGVSISYIDDVSLKLKTDDLDKLDDKSVNIKSQDIPYVTGSPYDQVIDLTGSGTTNNYDYSTSNKTQNIEVVIQNYAEEVDVDDLVRQINVKLAEVM
jgi:hypothetical membrane-anchored protein|nr:MAG TPA: tail tape measure [Caudoviricetes sp.]